MSIVTDFAAIKRGLDKLTGNDKPVVIQSRLHNEDLPGRIVVDDPWAHNFQLEKMWSDSVGRQCTVSSGDHKINGLSTTYPVTGSFTIANLESVSAQIADSIKAFEHRVERELNEFLFHPMTCVHARRAVTPSGPQCLHCGSPWADTWVERA
jgi:hypothetical protein